MPYRWPMSSCFPSFRINRDLPVIRMVACPPDLYPPTTGGHHISGMSGPFHQTNRFSVKVFIPADSVQFFRICDPIKVKMMQDSPRTVRHMSLIAVYQYEGWTRHRFPDTESSCHTSRKCGFSGAKISFQTDNAARRKHCCQLPSHVHRL